jgi:predicted ArsR family transcriptional regulator
MAKDPFLLVSLEESESKALAQVMSNDTARKILDHLSKKESATESEIAKELKIAISTVHYNLQALVKANLVQTEEFHYSKKGKEVLHYSLANKVIIIAPKKSSTESFKDKLKSIFPIALISIGAAAVIQVLQLVRPAAVPEEAQIMMYDAAADAAPRMMAKTAEESATAGASLAMQAAPPVANVASASEYLALWFLAGSLFTILVMTVWYYFSTRKAK